MNPEKESIGPTKMFFVDRNGILATYEFEPMDDQILARLVTEERGGKELSFSANDFIGNSMQEVIKEIEKDGYVLAASQESAGAARSAVDDEEMKRFKEADLAQRNVDALQAVKHRQSLDAFNETTGHKMDFDDLDAVTVGRDTAETKDEFRERVSGALDVRNKRWVRRGNRKARDRIERGEDNLAELRSQAMSSAGAGARFGSAVRRGWDEIKHLWARRNR